jgi:hypothetical protein
MRRVVVIAMLSLVSILARPQSLEAADLWGWIKALSGPGPFKGPQFELRLACLGVQPETVYAMRLAESRKQASDFLTEKVRVGGLGADRRAVEKVAAEARELPPNLDLLLLALKLETLAEELAHISGCATGQCPIAATAALQLRTAAADARALYRFQKTISGEMQVAAGAAASLCPFQQRPGRFSIGAVTRFMSWTDTDDDERFAGGNLMRHQSLSLAFTWRPIDGIRHPNLDIFDFGFGVGMYRFTSDDKLPGSIADLSGLLLEPIQISVHLPSSLRRKAGLFVPYGQFNRLIFWDGFPAGAFGPDLTGAKAGAIPASDGVWNLALFWDLTPLFDLIRK